MPEGDVVWRTAQRLDAALAGREIETWDLRWPSLATTDLTGHAVESVVSRGKHLLIRIAGLDAADPPWTLHSHLRMEGQWRIDPSSTPLRRSPDVRAVVGNAAWTATGLRLGMLDLVRRSEEGSLVGHLGPDLLGPDWDLERVLASLRADPDRTIGEALLDQRVLAGIGTFYLAESLFLAGRTPWTPVGAIDADARLTRIVDLARRLLTLNRERVPQVTTGDARPGREAYVHARSGRPCRRCAATIRVAPLGTGPQARVVFYCPSCQRGPAPTDDGRPQRPLGATARTGRRRRNERG